MSARPVVTVYTTPNCNAAWLCIGFTIGAALPAIAGWAAKR